MNELEKYPIGDLDWDGDPRDPSALLGTPTPAETVDLTKPLKIIADQIELLQRYTPPGYRPTRLEYFSSTILSAMLVGRSIKDQQKCINQSLIFAKERIEAIDG